MIRAAIAMIVTPLLMLTGFRFDKSYRHGETKIKALVYRFCDTVRANTWAGL